MELRNQEKAGDNYQISFLITSYIRSNNEHLKHQKLLYSPLSISQSQSSSQAPELLLLFNIHGKQQWSCWDGQLPDHTFPGQA